VNQKRLYRLTIHGRSPTTLEKSLGMDSRLADGARRVRFGLSVCRKHAAQADYVNAQVTRFGQGFARRDRSRHRTFAMKDQTSTDLVRRRCLVCDVECELVESPLSDEIGPPCPACGAPTERIAVLRTGLPPKNAHAVALGRLGGVKGGPARAKALTPQRRREIALRAIQARWRRAKR
jgi:hypothetical protein